MITIQFLETVAIVLGLGICLYVVRGMTDRSFGKMRDRAQILQHAAVYALLSSLLLIALPYLVYDGVRMGSSVAIGYNEGWNALHTSRLLHGGALYGPLTGLPLIPVNYPPLSFVLTAAVSYFSKNVLLSGRVISLLSFLSVACVIFRIVYVFESHRLAAISAALLWIALGVHVSNRFIGMFDPQMLGQVLALSAMYFYAAWKDTLTPSRTGMLALLCCTALFIKPVLVAVPITLTITLLLRGRRALLFFAASGIVFVAAMAVGSWLYGGSNFLVDLMLNATRTHGAEALPTKLLHWFRASRQYFGHRSYTVSLLFLPYIALLTRTNAARMPLLVYFPVSFLLGVSAVGEPGADVNWWFDFFIACSIVCGLLIAELSTWPNAGARVAGWGILTCILLPLALGVRNDLIRVLDYPRLQGQERVHLADVARLRSIAGPVLFEDPLLGFQAGREFLFDPFLGTLMMVRGRISETILTEPIRQRYFHAIVLGNDEYDLQETLGKIGGIEMVPQSPQPKATFTDRWTDNVLRAIGKNYAVRGQNPADRHFFYMPRDR